MPLSPACDVELVDLFDQHSQAKMVSKDEHYGKTVTLLCGSNTDDDVAGVQLTPSTGVVTEGNGDPTVVSVKLQTKPSSAVVVSSKLVGNDKTEVGPAAANIKISPEQWNQVQQFKVCSLTGFIRYVPVVETVPRKC